MAQWSSPPSRFLSGLSTEPRKSALGNFPFPNPFQANVYANDFNTYAAGDWTVTTTNSGTSALAAANGGALLLTTGATSSNYQGNRLLPASFAITPGYQAWFLANVTMVDTTLPNFLIGMTAGTVGSWTDGIYFTKATANQTISAVIRGSSASSTITSIATLPTAAAITPAVPSFSLGWYYDGLPIPTLYFFASPAIATYTAGALTAPVAFSGPSSPGGVMVAAASSDPSYTAPNVLTNLPAATMLLAPDLYVVTNSSAAKTMQVDYVMAAAELNRF
jgi:hypothetical protein